MPGTASNVCPARVCATYQCSMCVAKPFASQKALDQHARIKHDQVSLVNRTIPDIAVCPICNTNYHTRGRLVAHLSETRVRSQVRSTNCRTQFLALGWPILPASQLASFNERRNASARRMRKAGHTHDLAEAPARRGAPSVLKGFALVRKYIFCFCFCFHSDHLMRRKSVRQSEHAQQKGDASRLMLMPTATGEGEHQRQEDQRSRAGLNKRGRRVSARRCAGHPNRPSYRHDKITRTGDDDACSTLTTKQTTTTTTTPTSDEAAALNCTRLACWLPCVPIWHARHDGDTPTNTLYSSSAT